MLTCITCSKQQVEDEGEDVMARRSKDAVKNLTTQVAFSLSNTLHTCSFFYDFLIYSYLFIHTNKHFYPSFYDFILIQI
ncbi:hypothetical protein Hanom_Chr13g01206881 [Helianthus anomalus]